MTWGAQGGGMPSTRQWVIYGICGWVAAMLFGYALGQYGAAPRMDEPVDAGTATPDRVVTPAAPRTATTLIQARSEASERASESGQAESAAAEDDADQILVGVRGAVREPGYYWRPQGDRVQQLIEAAGGLAEDADLQDINLAAWLLD